MPSCRVGQLLRQNDALSAADRAPQPGQAGVARRSSIYFEVK